ncbi:hypothetical protein HaLaN_21827 [Haematococcus lacustris]|uniref:Uncharacterized protein n=1 Tax=Haematococcus lacustris TaxID=44745 RepID=A0A699ZSF5_HAELA|nr:hypothetical protein HaLaN_21827 [Haematococcus lacustris]
MPSSSLYPVLGLLEKEMGELFMKRHERAKQLVVFVGVAGIGTGEGPHAAARQPQAAASELGPSTPPPAKCSKRTKAEEAAGPT